MRKNPARKLPARKLLASFIAGALFIPNMGFTLGLGEIEVNSALNQKLNADIQLLSAAPEDGENLIIKLASRKEFSRAGLDRPYLLNDLRFKSAMIDGSLHIKVSSGSPIREPFLNFLVEVDWPNGHMIREYTILLDPPVFMTQAASASSPAASQTATAPEKGGFRPSSTSGANVVPVVVPLTAPGAGASSRPQAAGQPVAQQTQVTNPAFIPAPVMQQTTVNQPVGSYRIKSGDTAWSLADAMRPDQSVSVEQMMIAMLRLNPESFIDENINGLKRGYILRVPDYDQVAAINQQDAMALVREQAALWRQLQQSQAGAQPVSAMPSDGSGSDTAASGVTGEEDSAYLEIVSAGGGSSTMSAKDPTSMSAEELRAELALARERVETEKVEKEALQQRVDQLEQNVDLMKGMLSIEDNELSDVQALNAPADGEIAGEPTEVVDLQAEQELQETLAELSGEADTSDEMLTEAESGSVEATEEDAVFVDETEEGLAEAETQEAVAQDAEVQDAEIQEVEAPVSTMPEPVEQPDPLTKLLNDPMLLAAAGGGLLLIVALIALFVKRRKAAAEADATVVSGFDSIENVADELADDLAEDESLAGDKSADTQDSEEQTDTLAPNQEDLVDSDLDSILDSTEDTIVTETEDGSDKEEKPRDDVIAEADVYLAYGIYQQAEELLTQAIADHPERDDYRLKLAETHYAGKNAQAFVEVANELRNNAVDENTPEWKKVAVMGHELCPDESMFQGSMVSGIDSDSLTPKAPEMDFDLGLDNVEKGDAGEVSSDMDLSLDDAALELPEMEEDVTQIREADEEAKGDASEETDEPADVLEFDLSDTGAFQATDNIEEEFSLDIDATELDIDIQEETEETVVDSADEVQEVADVDIDFGLEDAETTDGAADEEISLDLTAEAESMELGSIEEAVEPETAEAEDDAEEDFDLSSLDDVDEISTKLDLARAYLDMGDHEGTREILDEVLADGNDEQKQEANELMEKLD